jgi:hypothetical protein
MIQTRNKVIPDCRILILMKGFNTFTHLSLHTKQIWKKSLSELNTLGSVVMFPLEQAMRHRGAEQV